jgi:hypothetical protein
MKTRLALALVLSLAATPAAVVAQEDPSLVPEQALVQQICAAAAADQAELDACVASVEAARVQLQAAPAEERTLLEQAADIVDDTLEELRQIDVEAAFDDLVQSAQEFELDVDVEGVQQAVDDAVAEAQDAISQISLDAEIDIRETIDQAVADALASAEEFDLQAAVDDALAEAQAAIDEADVQALIDEAVVAIEDGVEDARAVVAEAQQWVQENRDAVCRGGSISVGTTVGLAVFALTGVEWLGLQAFWAMERFSNGVCGDFAG